MTSGQPSKKSAKRSKSGRKPSDNFGLIAQIAFILLASVSVSAISYLSYVGYQKHIDPSNVHGDWIEIGAPPYSTDTLTFSNSGVSRNRRLISTSYEFDGSKIRFSTGSGMTVYKLSGSTRSPQLRRLYPESPAQSFVKEGYEDTVTSFGGGGMQKRRASLAEHFKP